MTGFEIPPSARASLEARAEKEGGRMIEWNGTEAYWSPDDLADAQLWRKQHEDGEISAVELKNQINTLHEIKLHGGVRIRHEHEPEPEPEVTPEQESLLTDPAAAHAATDAAVKRVYEAADPEWILLAKKAIKQVCEQRETFTTDDVWQTGLPQPREPRALGPLMRQAATAGLCEMTGRQVPTQIPDGHRHPHAEWRSLIYEADLP